MDVQNCQTTNLIKSYIKKDVYNKCKFYTLPTAG